MASRVLSDLMWLCWRPMVSSALVGVEMVNQPSMKAVRSNSPMEVDERRSQSARWETSSRAMLSAERYFWAPSIRILSGDVVG